MSAGRNGRWLGFSLLPTREKWGRDSAQRQILTGVGYLLHGGVSLKSSRPSYCQCWPTR